jgi:hypothetical protein
MITAINQFVCNKAEDMNMLTSKFKNFDVTSKVLLDNILQGYAICNAELKANSDGFCNRANKNFVSSQIIGVDIDNQKSVANENNEKVKHSLTVEEGYQSFHDIITDPFVKNNASFVYCTPSHTEEWNRIRIIFVLKNKITDTVIQKKLNKILTAYFNGDIAATTNCQIFYGSKNAKNEFFGNVLDDEIIKELLNDYKLNFDDKIQMEINNIDSTSITKEHLKEIVNYIFKDGKISNDRWWKIPTILKNAELLSDQEIEDIIYHAIGDIGDVKTKLKYAYKYKNTLSLGTLIFYAKENGYELRDEITSKSKIIKFWYIKRNVKEEKITVSISYNLLHTFLVNNGFWQIEHDKGSQLIKIDSSNQIEEVSEIRLREFVYDYVCNHKDIFEDKNEQFAVEEQIRRNSSMIFNSVKMDLPTFNKKLDELITDNDEYSYVFYLNGFLQISRHDIEFLDYGKLQGFIWKKSVLKRDYIKPDDKKSEYQSFIEKVCSTRKENGSIEFNSKKYDSFRSVIGYLLNRNKSRASIKAIVLCDEAISNSPNGGTGKSIFADALGKIRNSTIIDGRLFDSNSPFRFETVSESTDVINIDDCSPKFQFDKLFHIITGDLTVERKGISRFTIPFERSPKLCFSTNHTFRGDGNSHERRIFEIEFSNYFNAKNTPMNEFGHQLFYDWDIKEANRFDGFMSTCIQYYLQNGLVKYNTVNLEFKKLVENTSQELAEYLEQYIKTDTIYRTDNILEDFNQLQKLNITQTALTQAINYWSNSFKKLTLLGDFDRNIKTKIFVINTNPNTNWKDWKKSEQYEKIKNGVETRPSDLNEFSFEKSMDELVA